MHDVREVFSALKENLDQLMSTLQDGLILFTRDGRIVLVSASAERFIGRPRGEMLGQMVEDVFDDSNRLGRIVLDAFALRQDVPSREIEIEHGRRVQLSLDFISERGVPSARCSPCAMPSPSAALKMRSSSRAASPPSDA